MHRKLTTAIFVLVPLVILAVVVRPLEWDRMTVRIGFVILVTCAVCGNWWRIRRRLAPDNVRESMILNRMALGGLALQTVGFVMYAVRVVY